MPELRGVLRANATDRPHKIAADETNPRGAPWRTVSCRFAGEAMADFAKVVFPEYASPGGRAVWRSGALDALGPRGS